VPRYTGCPVGLVQQFEPPFNLLTFLPPRHRSGRADLQVAGVEPTSTGSASGINGHGGVELAPVPGSVAGPLHP